MFTKMHSQEFHVKSDFELSIFIKWLNFYIHERRPNSVSVSGKTTPHSEGLEMDMEPELLSEEGIAGTS